MNGYLQCLIDQYEGKARKALGGAERTVYREVLNDLLKFKEYVEKPEEETTNKDIPRKHIIVDFAGPIKDLGEYLKNFRGKTTEEFLKEFMKEGE
ncbi:MAG: hypothetical protein LKE46_01660 [Clostridium sp.]|jgi:hypothetical protein|uniref:hypothetical protein n=1 Tax=Clostridium sp. TaxID=1506 RepID=UPI0025C15DC1|nr:hypothetical protein [Clostridium sp.]MCH3962956.1 hypothetical protein [Clostridium sp.]MCI1800165.1 hypothetical protein [Clostridium sp.]MCI2200160.1 hypothetical protein [Clostridium sp.]